MSFCSEISFYWGVFAVRSVSTEVFSPSDTVPLMSFSSEMNFTDVFFQCH